MKYSMTWMAGCAICAFAGMAQADCAADLARFTDTAAMTGDSADAASGGTEGIAKDGSLAPLEGTEAEPGTAVAMSGSDVQAQQEGEPTAAEEAEGDEAMPDRDSLIANAERALAEGDEAACQEAVDQLEAM